MPFQAVSLSGAPNGKVIVVAATSFTLAAGVSGTTIHQAVSGTEAWDELWLWATNGDGSSRNLTIGWGVAPGVAFDTGLNLAVHSTIFTTGETKAVISGLRLQNSLMVGAIGSLANAFKITGYVNRITPDE